jgi:hypothetical protein
VIGATSLPESVSAVLMMMYDGKQLLQSGLFRQTDIDGVDDNLKSCQHGQPYQLGFGGVLHSASVQTQASPTEKVSHTPQEDCE